MIDKREILDLATQLSLNPHVVEKDYVLGWMLAGINAHPDLQNSWVFKGGTCLKKCFFETYRFSEDLDFTLTDETHLTEAFLEKTLSEVGEWIEQQTGIQVPADKQKFDIYRNPRGNLSCQGKISYRGPVSARDMPRIKLDLTADEKLVLPPVVSPVYHPYTDAPDDGIQILSYAYEEVFGEKVRALGERTRPRDLYDVINLFRNQEQLPTAAVLLDVLRQKCAFKGIGVPEMSTLEPHREELTGLWENMLNHQLPSLPPYEAFWDALPDFFGWLTGQSDRPVLTAYAGTAGEVVLRDRVLDIRVPERARSTIEVIRFAAANRLLVNLTYNGSIRTIEPYSLRQTKDGNIILHAIRADSREHRSYRVDRMQSASVLRESFVPTYAIELTPSGALNVPPTVRGGASSRPSAGNSRPHRATGRAGTNSGPVHIYQCPICNKKFRRKTRDSRLNAHKNEWGQPCPGCTGFYVETNY